MVRLYYISENYGNFAFVRFRTGKIAFKPGERDYVFDVQ